MGLVIPAAPALPAPPGHDGGAGPPPLPEGSEVSFEEILAHLGQGGEPAGGGGPPPAAEDAAPAPPAAEGTPDGAAQDPSPDHSLGVMGLDFAWLMAPAGPGSPPPEPLPAGEPLAPRGDAGAALPAGPASVAAVAGAPAGAPVASAGGPGVTAAGPAVIPATANHDASGEAAQASQPPASQPAPVASQASPLPASQPAPEVPATASTPTPADTGETPRPSGSEHAEPGPLRGLMVAAGRATSERPAELLAARLATIAPVATEGPPQQAAVEAPAASADGQAAIPAAFVRPGGSAGAGGQPAAKEAVLASLDGDTGDVISTVEAPPSPGQPDDTDAGSGQPSRDAPGWPATAPTPGPAGTADAAVTRPDAGVVTTPATSPEVPGAAATAEQAAREVSAASDPALRAAGVARQVVDALRILPAGDGRHEVRMRLTPPEMGEVHVVMLVSRGHASVHIGASSEAARQAIESALPQLAQGLQERNLQPEQLRVTLQDGALTGDTGDAQGRGRGWYGQEERESLPAPSQVLAPPRGTRGPRRSAWGPGSRVDFRA